MVSKRYALVNTARCVSCGACQNECPRAAIRVWRGCYAVVSREACVGCGRCGKVCPADCITFRDREVRA